MTDETPSSDSNVESVRASQKPATAGAPPPVPTPGLGTGGRVTSIPTELPPDFALQDIETVEPDTEPMSEIGRLTGVFFEPSKAFADIARRPRWWIPLLVSSVIAICFAYALDTRIGWEDAMRQTMVQSPFTQNLTPQQMEALVRQQATVARYVSYAAPITSAIFVAIIAVVLMFLSDIIMGAGIGLKKMMGIVAYGMLPYSISSLLAIVVMYLKPPADFDLQNPVAFNLGAFLPADVPGWLVGLGRSFDLFFIWIIVLLAIGIAAASRKMNFGKAFGMMLIPAGLIVLLRVVQGAAEG